MVNIKSTRDYVLEENLQEALNQGRNVWVIGDVHGYHQTLLMLIERLNLQPDDWVVMLGDLIDRGPNSFGVVHSVSQHPQFVSVLGNHEAMMIEQFHPQRMESGDMDFLLWMRNGGYETVESYRRAFISNDGKVDEQGMRIVVVEHVDWMRTLPLHIVLDKWRLVHAGYRPDVPLDEQEEDDYLWIRGPFHRATSPLDDQRTIVFGHTPTVSLPGRSYTEWGKVWASAHVLGDGRPSSLGIDTCVFHDQPYPKQLTAFNLATMEFIQQERIEG